MKSRCICPSCKAVLEFDRAKYSTVKCPKCTQQANVNDFTEVPMADIPCPYCKVTLRVTKTASEKGMTCPKCKHTITPRKKIEVEHTAMPIRSQSSNQLYRPGKLELIEGEAHWLSQENTTIVLVRGDNMLGRKSPSSTINIQIPTSDSHMSRSHAKIEVKMIEDSTFVHYLSDAGSANGTYHNDECLESDDIIKLALGDKIRMGQTVLKFVE